MRTLKKTIALLSPGERKRGLLIFFLAMGMALIEATGMASVMPFLAVLGDPDMLDSNPVLSVIFNKSRFIGIETHDDFLIFLGLGAFFLIIISASYRTLTHFVMNRYVQLLQHGLSTRLMEAYLLQPYAFFLERHSGDMSKAVLSEVATVVGNVLQPVFNLAISSLLLVAITALLLVVNPWLALLAAGLLSTLYTLIFLSLKQKLRRLGSTLVAANKDRFMAASEVFGGIKVIKLLGCEQSYLSRFESPSRSFAATQATYQTMNQIPNFVIEALIFGTMLLLTIVLMVAAGGLDNQVLGQILPVLGLYAFAAYRMKPAVHSIYQGIAGLRFGRAAVDNLYADLCAYRAMRRVSTMDTLPFKAKSTILLQHLSYIYPGSDKPALNDLNLDIPVGSTLGIVGSTGAGKTTLVDVLLGLLRPTRGAIIIDGREVVNEEVHAWQKSLGYVPQDIFLTDSTIAENIALGIPREAINQNQVESCASMAQIHDFIVHDLPAKYQTLVGERGVRLSGGQRQRIGIARALYHNPEVLVFDEATSALDTATEQGVMDAINSLSNKKTIILIAHRLSTVKNCDQIILLDRGAIAVRGKYDELVHSSVQFRTLSGAC